MLILRYLGKLDPGYSQHSALATLELSKVEKKNKKKIRGVNWVKPLSNILF